MRTRFAAIIPILAVAAVVSAQTAFTYQGRIKNGPQVASGPYDLRFKLFDSPSGGAQLGTTQCFNNVAVTDGVFTTTVDFGQQFATTAGRFLEIEARADTGLACADTTGFIVLGPRQLMTASPRAAQAATAFSLSSPDGSPTNALVVSNAGNIGIGTVSPSQPLQVANDLPVMILQDTGSAATQSGYLGFWSSSGAETGWVGFGSPTDAHFSIFNGRPGGDIAFFPGPSANVRVHGTIKLGTTAQLFAPGGEENLRIIRGVVLGDGTLLAGTGYTVTPLATGKYRIDFQTAFNGPPTVTVSAQTSITSPITNAAWSELFSGKVSIQTRDSSGNLVSGDFSFTAIGLR